MFRWQILKLNTYSSFISRLDATNTKFHVFSCGSIDAAFSVILSSFCKQWFWQMLPPVAQILCFYLLCFASARHSLSGVCQIHIFWCGFQFIAFNSHPHTSKKQNKCVVFAFQPMEYFQEKFKNHGDNFFDNVEKS